MRFRSSSNRPPFLNTRDQWRLLKLFAGLVVVMISIKVAANPENWTWMFPRQAAQQPDESSPQKTAESGRKDLPPGAFRSRKEKTAEADEKGKNAEDEPQGSETETPPTAKDPPTAKTAEESTAEDGFSARDVDPSLLEPIRDDTVGIRSEELDVYHTLLAKVHRTPQATLRARADDEVVYTALMADSAHFRGRLITIEGEVKRLHEIPVVENEHGIETLYAAWILTRDSGQNPYRVVCTSIPKGIPQGQTIREPVRVRLTGYFFKRQSYQAVHGLHTAPLLLAGQPVWLRTSETAMRADDFGRYLLIFILLIGVIVAFAMWRLTVGDKRFQLGPKKRATEPPEEAVQGLNDLETTTVDEALRELSQNEDQPDEPSSTDEQSQRRSDDGPSAG